MSIARNPALNKARRATVSSRRFSPSSLMLSHRNRAGNVVRGSGVLPDNNVRQKDEEISKGNSSPDGKVSGMDNAAARETMPLMPVQLKATMTTGAAWDPYVRSMETAFSEDTPPGTPR